MFYALLGAALVVLALVMLVRNVSDNRAYEARHPEEARAKYAFVARYLRIGLLLPATVFPLLLFAQGFVWQGIVFVGFALAVWLFYGYTVRRSRPPRDGY